MALVAFTWHPVKAQEIVTRIALHQSQPIEIEVKAGEVLEVLFADGPVVVSESQSALGKEIRTWNNYGALGFHQSYPLAGPCWLKVSTNSGDTVISYRKRSNIETTSTIPTSAVVIPTDATGPVNVILESSTDLVTWTQAVPGTYGASTAKRFFRVRAVNQ